MVQTVDLIVHGAGQLLTVPNSGPLSGSLAGELGLVTDGGVAVSGQRIVAVGKGDDIRANYQAPNELDANGGVVLPGLVDAHTHLVFAGSRAEEFVQRIRGASYQAIMAEGGGIMITVRATRLAPMDRLIDAAHERLTNMLRHGTTTAEVKTGYGLTVEAELKSMAVIGELQGRQPISLVPTFLGAHAIPSEYAQRPEAYVDLIVYEMLDAVNEQYRARWEDRFNDKPLSCDVFCDQGAFDLAQSRRILMAAQSKGMPVKIHADEFAHLGAAALAAELGAVSAEHLVRTSSQEMRALAASGTVAVLLPGTPFGLGTNDYANAREMISCGLAVALGTDLNPGTCYCESLPFIMAVACRTMRMTPEEVIVAATANAAWAVGRGAVVGSLAPGYMADLVILNSDDYRDLAYRFGGNLVRTVVKAGQTVVSQ